MVDLLVLGTGAIVITLLEVPVASWPSDISTCRTQNLQGTPFTGQYAYEASCEDKQGSKTLGF